MASGEIGVNAGEIGANAGEIGVNARRVTPKICTFSRPRNQDIIK